VRNRLVAAVLATLSVVALAGCTTPSPGTPTPDSRSSTDETSTSTTENDDDLPSDGAPKVTNPIDVSHFEQNPCDAFTPAQAQQFDLEAGKRQDTDFGNGCAWRNPETGGSVTLGFASVDKRGLSSTYRAEKEGDFTYFEPIDDIEGHPAVAYDVNSSKPTAACFVDVGVTDELTFATRVGLSASNVGEKDPCELSAQVAGMILKNMQERS